MDMERLNREFSRLKAAGKKDPIIKLINALTGNKKVDDDDLFVIEGLWAYEKLIQSNVRIRAFVFCPDYIKSEALLRITRHFINAAEDSYLISAGLCDRISSREGGEGFFLLCCFQSCNFGDIQLKEDNLLLVLDGLEKPGNIGTIIRSVDAAGGNGVIICNSRVRKTNQKLIKSSMGSSFIVPVVESSIEETIAWLKSSGFKIIVTDLKAVNSYREADYTGRVAIVAGNEIRGISDHWNEHRCDRVVIPMFGGADSLNVGVAATLVIYEASCRQRKLIGNSM